MDSLLVIQNNTRTSILKAGVNFKKSPRERITKSYIKTRLENLELHWDSYRKTHKEIMKTATPKEMREIEYFVSDMFTICEEEYIEIKSDMMQKIEQLCESTSHTQQLSAIDQLVPEVKLPKINIPQFSGNYNDWCTFRDLYTSLIHNNSTLSEVQKLHYLKCSIAGEAQQLLKHIQVTENNYKVAWEVLNERYSNKRVIVNAILNRLLAQKKIFNESSKGIKEILDTTSECLNNMKNQNINIENWDPIIIHLTVNKLDPITHKKWEEELNDLPVEELPTWKQLSKFLEGRFRVLEMVQIRQQKEKSTIQLKTFHASTSSNSNISCPYCKQNHFIYFCKEFLNLNEAKKTEFVQKQRLCFNCMIPGHSVKYCKNKNTCRRCGKRHHTTLHKNLTTNNTTTTSDEQQQHIVSHLITGDVTALMSTAVVRVTNEHGQKFMLRALLDPCSQESFISESAATLLNVKRRSTNGQVSGVGQMRTPIKFATDIEISPRIKSEKKMKITTYIVRKVTNIMPAKTLRFENWNHLKDLELADPTFYQPGHIDLLLGIDVYNEVLLPGLIKGVSGSPTAIQTLLGWILFGKVETIGKEQETTNKTNIVTMHLNFDINSMLQKFWELESIDEERKQLTPEEARAEELYTKHTTRTRDGRYVVHLPFKTDTPILPKNTRDIAVERWKATERRLIKDKSLFEEYNKVLEEYIKLNHMEKVEQEETKDYDKYVYLPHHGVIKEDRKTSKLRVVYDASCRGSNNVSLNDLLLIGPPQTEELRTIILRWRKHKIAFVADIEKMYRQIRVHQPHTDFQRIVWRSDPSKPIEDYRLLTVTFGTACAPYLAVKTLKQTALDEGSMYPDAQRRILEDFYVDDLLTGSDSVEEAIEIKRDITTILEAGGFNLQKWSSNNETFMTTFNLNEENENKNIKERESVKTLGLTWEVKTDKLSICNHVQNRNGSTTTKRNVLSVIAALYDPMGWMAPTVILAKIYMQKLWKSGVSWDEDLPKELNNEWHQFETELSSLKEISLCRWIHTTSTNSELELHGFADASESAYAAVVYARVVDEEGDINISLITAKTKVAPIKQLTLPRLELCAANLLTRLLKQVTTALHISLKNVYAYSDSQVVLSWIHGDPLRWKPFVKNRVIEIINILDASHWFYVNTKNNPADPASRGVMPSKLLNTKIWWNGPEFLKEKELELVKGNNIETSLEKRKNMICMLTAKEDTTEEVLTLLKGYSSLDKLVRVLAYCRRWLKILDKSKKPYLPSNTYLTCEERCNALTICLKMSQKIEFSDEIQDLKHGRPLKTKSKLLALNPILDKQGLLRVGGRLKHADMEFVRKHPIIISKDNVLMPLLLSDAHLKTIHGGPQMMITLLRSKYWLINAGNTVKRFVRNCVICAKQKATTGHQLMGNLPESRVKPSRPFSITGVDFAGPINVRMSKGRGAKSYKSYICLFICMATKAIHIEVVSDMTTQAFLAAFKRFCSRRGHITEIWSDHGTTFVGAEKELLNMWKQGRNNLPDEISNSLAQKGTTWRYIPPGAPNFGGLWEAGVKSTKFHLKRIVGESKLTFEELNTVLTQIEACLNSRPLSPISDHPDDLEPLTPGHFLIGEPLIVLPCHDITTHKVVALDRWQLTTRMVQNFWKRWQSEYLSRLQERNKWRQKQKEFEKGDLILLKDERLPPGQWRLGRVVEKYPGRDNLTRTYDIRTSTGVYRRPVTALCSLPINDYKTN